MIDEVRPNEHRDVIIQHVTTADPAGGAANSRWVVFLGDSKRGEMDDSRRAMVFARLLADLSQGRVWVRHEDEEGLRPLDSRSISGCSCC